LLLIFIIKDSQSKIYAKKFALPVDIFTRMPQNFNLNILLNGQCGVGKSSFVNSCYTTLRSSHAVNRQMAPVKGDSRGVTSELRRYKLFDIDEDPQTPGKEVSLLDMWGFDNDKSYEAFEAILEGLLPTGFKRGDSIDNRHLEKKCPENQPH